MTNILQQINLEAVESPDKLIDSAEKYYINEIASIADTISADDNIKFVSIAGPSGSGKTTTAHILCDRLNERGENTIVVSLDDFYLPTDLLPILDDGKHDIESVNALDIELIKKCFTEIITNGKTMLPKYDFAGKKRILEARKADISNHGIIIVEGLHALNPVITGLVPERNIFKTYISVNCPIIDSSGRQILSSRQIRLIRRTLRDRIFRGASINDTLALWNGVVEGEKKYLYCFKNTADVLIKTLHLYEPCLYKNDFIALKNEIDKDNVYYDYFMKTAEALEAFESIDPSLVPHGSLVREFIGNGKYN